MNCPTCSGVLEPDAAFCGICGARLRARRTTLTGSVLSGEYRIESKIAEGGFGTIYRAIHIDSGLDVALKVLHADLAADPNLAARFRREGATLSRLHDPHTVATYDVGEDADGTLYIAMELLQGESLHDRLARGTLPWRGALAIVRDVCSSLAEAHDLGITHRDLKPANVHLTENDHVKLLDFGIAKVDGSSVDDGAQLTRMGQTIGTLEYMAPEQIIGGLCDRRSDIYQLGVLLFEMITGRRPFAEATEPTAMITSLLTLVAPAPSSVLPGLPPALDVLIARCLEREPEHRFANVRELVRAIAGLLALPDTAQPRLTTTIAAEVGDEPTTIGGAPAMIYAPPPPRVTAIGPGPQLTPGRIPAFEVPVRGSVADGAALSFGEGTGSTSAAPPKGSVTAIGEAIVESLAEIDEPPAPAPPARIARGSATPPLPMPAVTPMLAPIEKAPAPPEHVAIVAPAPAKRMSFAARIALWTFALAAAGAGIGAAIALAAR